MRFFYNQQYLHIKHKLIKENTFNAYSILLVDDKRQVSLLKIKHLILYLTFEHKFFEIYEKINLNINLELIYKLIK